MAKEKKIKEPKIKKSKYPEGYIGRPKPMKTKTFEFHKPTFLCCSHYYLSPYIRYHSYFRNRMAFRLELFDRNSNSYFWNSLSIDLLSSFCSLGKLAFKNSKHSTAAFWACSYQIAYNSVLMSPPGNGAP